MKKFVFFIFAVCRIYAYEYELAVCSIFRDEARFLKEWVEFHKLIGVEHFYLYNHFSQDDYQSVLEPYILSGEIELFEWPYESCNINEFRKVQAGAFTNALRLAEGKVKWLAFIDTDEFLFSPISDSILPILENYEKFGAVCANWQMFGTSYVKRIPENGLMIELLTLKAYSNNESHKVFKIIVRPERMEKMLSSRYGKFHKPYYAVDMKGNRVNSDSSTRSSFIDQLRINHYWSRDEDFFNEVKVGRQKQWTSKSWGGDRKKSEQRLRDFNKIHDGAILRFVPLLRKQMFGDDD